MTVIAIRLIKKEMRAMRKSSKGSYTVEATIVISSLLIALCAVMFAFMLMYQNVVIIYAASYGAQQGARSWVNTGISMDGTSREYTSGLYSDIAELTGGGDTSAKKKKIENAVKDKLKMSVFSTNTANINVNFENNILQRKVVVDIKQTIPIPFSGIAKFFNNGEAFALKAKMEATVAEPTEYIRNIDYALEWIQSAGKWLKETLGNDAGSKAAGKIKGLK